MATRRRPPVPIKVQLEVYFQNGWLCSLCNRPTIFSLVLKRIEALVGERLPQQPLAYYTTSNGGGTVLHCWMSWPPALITCGRIDVVGPMTRPTLLSPVQGAMLARATANGPHTSRRTRPGRLRASTAPLSIGTA
jgi:hypothetical protein